MPDTSKTRAEAVLSEDLEDFKVPGVAIVLDPEAAEEMGAFEEDAVDAADAWEANIDPAE